ncbi:hypothetical protein DUNSADRAFT_5213 [Dunaliella salina]|uniref:SET domain-containing protein n=1 Tax=Dunaliella salina TaxID=3046 RepID=A0ABQ7GQP8_DUNSA|nr:hypothetical protein DUNSADRAFT_5213 [Dunaliella salina]|eukprot:KAF5836936.1 hypothetical protein DUNSADRAFT_5213 [Dunaliella salina]
MEESQLSEAGRSKRSRRKKDGRNRREGIAADEELLAIPRGLMLEPSSFEPLTPVHPAGAPAAQEGASSLLPAHLPESMPQASLALTFLQHYRRQQQQQQQQQEQNQQQGQVQQQHKQHQEQHQQHQQQQPQHQQHAVCPEQQQQQQKQPQLPLQPEQQPEQQPEVQEGHQRHKDKYSCGTVSWNVPEEAQHSVQEQSVRLPAAFFQCLPSETDLFGILPVLAHLRQQRQQEQRQHEQPQHEQPQHEQPQHEQPQHEQLQHEQPQREQPQHEQPQREQPQHEQPQVGGCQVQLQHQVQLPLSQAPQQMAPHGTHSPPSLIAAALAPSPTASAALASQVERLEEEWQALQGPPFSRIMIQLGLAQPGQERVSAGSRINSPGRTNIRPQGELSGSCVGSEGLEGPLTLSERQGAEGMQQEGALPGIRGSEGAWACTCSGNSSSGPHSRGPAWCLPSQYLWARGLVWSRAIHLWSGPTFVPAIDLLNHAYPPNIRCMVRSEDDVDGADCSVSDEAGCSDEGSSSSSSNSSSSNSSSSSSSVPLGIVTRYTSVRQREMFVCHAIRPLPPGTQALWHYNSHSLDAGWLLCYGFVPEDKSSRPHRSCAGPNELDHAIAQLDMEIDQQGVKISGGVGVRHPAYMAVDLGMLKAVRSLLVRERGPGESA